MWPLGCTGVQGLLRSIGGEVPGHLLVIDLQGSHDLQCVGLYVPNNAHDCCTFFEDLYKFVGDNTVLLGDFNSVTTPEDHLSGNLDATSALLQDTLQSLGFVEISGSHCHVFSYHHPSILSWKSRIDCIYTNFANNTLRGYASPCGITDHYLIGCFTLPNKAFGPK